MAKRLKLHVLVMDFIGHDGWPCPRLKDARLSSGQLSRVYGKVVRYMRRMYHECSLVHGDLSEYNILYVKLKTVEV